jgi:hypothetical protein
MWGIVQINGREALLNLDLLFAYVRRPDGGADAISLTGAAVPLDDRFDVIKGELEEGDEVDELPRQDGGQAPSAA